MEANNKPIDYSGLYLGTGAGYLFLTFLKIISQNLQPTALIYTALTATLSSVFFLAKHLGLERNHNFEFMLGLTAVGAAVFTQTLLDPKNAHPIPEGVLINFTVVSAIAGLGLLADRFLPNRH